jgi:F420-dependent oxidoreductase-like protein
VHVGHWTSSPADPLPIVREAERLGFESAWTSEAWGSDAVTVAAWIAAHTERIHVGTAVMQIAARTPAATAMTAITLDHLSGGRFRLGLGVSGPQVVEGWHGVPYRDPVGWTREYVEVVRRIFERRGPVEFHGRHVRLPASGGLGIGKPLRSAVPPLRARLPIYLAALGPRNVALAGEIADGWLPILFSPERTAPLRRRLLEALERAGRRPDAFDVAAMVPVVAGDDLDACRDRVRPFVAFYVGGMGSRERNYYASLVAGYGFAEAVARIQELFLSGRRREAGAAVPESLVEEIALLGPVARIRDRLAAWREAGVTTLLAQTDDVGSLRALAEANE